MTEKNITDKELIELVKKCRSGTEVADEEIELLARFQSHATELDRVRAECEKYKEKADKWDALDEKIGKCYPDYDDSGNEVHTEDSEGADLCTIGEIACIAFKYL